MKIYNCIIMTLVCHKFWYNYTRTNRIRYIPYRHRVVALVSIHNPINIEQIWCRIRGLLIIHRNHSDYRGHHHHSQHT